MPVFPETLVETVKVPSPVYQTDRSSVPFCIVVGVKVEAVEVAALLLSEMVQVAVPALPAIVV